MSDPEPENNDDFEIDEDDMDTISLIEDILAGGLKGDNIDDFPIDIVDSGESGNEEGEDKEDDGDSQNSS